MFLRDCTFLFLDHKYIYVGLQVEWNFFGRSYIYIIKDIIASYDSASLKDVSANFYCPEFYRLNYKTKIRVESKTKHEESKILEIKRNHYENKTSAFSHIGGLEKQINLLNKYIQLLFKSKSCISKCDLLCL